MSICLTDTSVFTNFLNVPSKNAHRNEVITRLRELTENGTTLLLPFATILETGNHIAQNGNGNQRRKCAQDFVKCVQATFQDEAPWGPIAFPTIEEMGQYLVDFPDSATRSVGLGDFSIIKDYDKLCTQHQGQRVFIWSYDNDLAGYDRAPVI